MCYCVCVCGCWYPGKLISPGWRMYVRRILIPVFPFSRFPVFRFPVTVITAAIPFTCPRSRRRRRRRRLAHQPACAPLAAACVASVAAAGVFERL